MNQPWVEAQKDTDVWSTEVQYICTSSITQHMCWKQNSHVSIFFSCSFFLKSAVNRGGTVEVQVELEVTVIICIFK